MQHCPILVCSWGIVVFPNPTSEWTEVGFFSFFYLLPQAKGSMWVPWLTAAIEGHLQWWSLNFPWLCLVLACSWRESISFHQPLSTRKEALWPQIELGTQGGYLVLDKPFRLEPVWAALSRAKAVMQPSPAVRAAFCWASLRMYCRTLCGWEVSQAGFSSHSKSLYWRFTQMYWFHWGLITPEVCGGH